MSGIIKKIFGIICLINGFLFVPSCTKEKEDDSLSLSDYVGIYQVEYCYWLGNSDIDINGDGYKEANWLREYKGVSGYVEDWVRGEVALLDNGDLSIHTAIPIFVATPIKDDMYYYSIKYYGVDHIAHLSKAGADKGTLGGNMYYASSGNHEYGLNDCSIYFKSPDEYDLYAHCSIMDPEDSQVYEGTVHFILKKR